MRKRSFLSILISAILISGVLSCSKTVDPADEDPTTVAITSKTISGKLVRKKYDALASNYYMQKWDLGAAKIKFSYGVNETIVSADIAADGSFTVNLPATLDANRFFSPTTDLRITPSPTTLKWTMVPLVITVDYVETGVSISGLVKFNSFTDNTFNTIKTYFSVYCFDRDGSVVGTNSFSGDSYNLSAAKGWNFMIWNHSTDKLQYSLTSTIPSDVYLYL